MGDIRARSSVAGGILRGVPGCVTTAENELKWPGRLVEEMSVTDDSYFLTSNLNFSQFRQLCQLFRSICFRQRGVNDHTQIWSINCLKCAGLKNQPSGKRMIQFFWAGVGCLDIMTWPPGSEFWAASLQISYQSLEPWLSDIPLSTSTKESQQPLCFFFPIGE